MNYFLVFKNEVIGVLSRESFGIKVDAGSDALRKLAPLLTSDVSHFLENLLPEGYELAKIAGAARVSESDKYALVCFYGEDMLGSIRIVSQDRLNCVSNGGFYQRADDDYIHLRIFREDNASYEDAVQRIANNKETRLSLPGAQGKFGVAIFDGHVHIPMDGALSTHIVKYDSNPEYQDVTLNEFLCLSAARSVGLSVPDFHFVAQSGALVLSRYDRRIINNNHVMTLHQIDFCQALNIPSYMKYQKEEQAPGVAAIIDVIKRCSYNPAQDISDFMDYFIFSLLIGNKDNHLKNYSLIYDEDKIRLAPCYDVVCTDVYVGLSQTFSLLVNGKSRMDDVGIHDLAATFGVNTALIARKTQVMIAKLDGFFAHDAGRLVLQENQPDGFNAMFEKIARVYQFNKKLLAVNGRL